MGLGSLFSRGAQLAEVSEASLRLDDVIHQASVQFDETGIAPTAATPEVTATGRTKRSKTMKVDRPFIFAIRCERLEAILYMGRIDDPTKM